MVNMMKTLFIALAIACLLLSSCATGDPSGSLITTETESSMESLTTTETESSTENQPITSKEIAEYAHEFEAGLVPNNLKCDPQKRMLPSHSNLMTIEPGLPVEQVYEITGDPQRVTIVSDSSAPMVNSMPPSNYVCYIYDTIEGIPVGITYTLTLRGEEIKFEVLSVFDNIQER